MMERTRKQGSAGTPLPGNGLAWMRGCGIIAAVFAASVTVAAAEPLHRAAQARDCVHEAYLDQVECDLTAPDPDSCADEYCQSLLRCIARFGVYDEVPGCRVRDPLAGPDVPGAEQKSGRSADSQSK